MVYSLQDVLATIVGPGGVVSMGAASALAKEGITVDFVDDKDAMIMGGDGNGVHSLHASNAATVTVRLMKTSYANAPLNNMYNTQRMSSLFWGQNIITITNPITGDNYTCTDVAFKKHTSVTWAEDPGMNEWVFNAIHADPQLGLGI